MAEKLALVAIRPDSGRHLPGMRPQVNACLAGLLVAELVVEGVVGQGDVMTDLDGRKPPGTEIARFGYP